MLVFHFSKLSEWKKELGKKIHKRMLLWYALFLLLVLLDEYLKEGYVIKLEDFTKPPSHEFILLLGTIVFLIVRILLRMRKTAYA